MSQTAAPKARPSGRAPLIFAVLGVVVALAAGGLYVFRQLEKPRVLNPEDAVNEFLSAVFLSQDVERASTVVCDTWDPDDAVTRTTNSVPSGAHVSWSDLNASTTGDRSTVRARLGFRLADDSRPSSFAVWQFALVNEGGWRVCDARPLA